MIARVERRPVPSEEVAVGEMTKVEVQLLLALAYMGDQREGEQAIVRAFPDRDFTDLHPRDEFLRPLNRISVANP